MQSTSDIQPHNMFPAARADSPDLADEEVRLSKPSGAFPTAPAIKSAHAPTVGLHVSTAPAAAPDPIPPVGTKVDRAIAYLARCDGKPASREDLAIAMDIKSKDLHAYIKTAIPNGRIAVDGHQFRLGAGVQSVPTAPATRVKTPPKEVRIPAQPTPKAAQSPEAVVDLPIASMSVGNLSLAIWGDGRLSVRTGAQIADLSVRETTVLRTFLELEELAQVSLT